MLTLSFLIWYVFPSILRLEFISCWTERLQDGTLTDSTAAIEAAWGKVAQEIREDPKYIFAATHGKRAADSLSRFKPNIKEHEMNNEVHKFEESILFFADAYKLHGPGSKSRVSTGQTPID